MNNFLCDWDVTTLDVSVLNPDSFCKYNEMMLKFDDPVFHLNLRSQSFQVVQKSFDINGGFKKILATMVTTEDQFA